MNIKNLSAGQHYPEQFNAVIEIPKGSRNKYEYDEDLDVIKLDRVNYTAMAHPFDYGFIPGTRSEDGDHLDTFVILDSSVFPGCLVEARPIGVLYMIDDGEKDEKIISVPLNDIRYKHVNELSGLNPHIKPEIQHFFEHYKDLQNKKVEITGWGDKKAALDLMNSVLEKNS